MAKTELDSKMNLQGHEKGHTYRQWFIAIVANTTLLTYGLQAGWISPMTKFLQSDRSPTGQPLSDTDLSFIASVICLVAVIGVPLYTYIADAYGRRTGIILIALPQALCWLIKFSSANTATLLAARVFSGLAAGGCFNILPIYVKEISRDDIRGLTGSLMMLSSNIGFLLIYILGAYLEYFTLLWTVFWVPILTIFLMFKSPESPSYLVKVGKEEEAISTIAWLRGLDPTEKSIQNELNDIKCEKLHYESLPSLSFISIFKYQPWRSAILLMMITMTTCALNGTFTILMYASAVLGASGSSESAELQSLSFPIIMVVGGFISVNCVERFGRKPLIAITQLMISASMLGLGAAIYCRQQGSSVPGWLPTTLMVVTVGSYSAGSGPVPYIMMSEMFNFQIRAKVLGLIVSHSWAVNFIQLLAYAPIAATLGATWVFVGFGCVNALGFIVTLALLPETKGKSVDEIEAWFGKK